MTIETVRDDLTTKTSADLIARVNQTAEFMVDDRGFICVVEPLKGHPEGRGLGPKPVEIISYDKAQLLNSDEEFPRDYHTMLKGLYLSD